MTFQRLMGSRRDRSAAEWNHRSTTVDCDQTDVYSVRTASHEVPPEWWCWHSVNSSANYCTKRTLTVFRW